MMLEVLVEEPSAELALRELLPRIVPNIAFDVLPFQGKFALLRKLPGRLQGYRYRIQNENLKVVVLVDRDREDCHELKRKLEELAAAQLTTLTSAMSASQAALATRIAIEELESWFLGDVAAVCRAYPGVPRTLAQRRGYRNPDEITGCWERLEKVLQDAGHFRSGLNKGQAARKISEYMDVESNRSVSFQQFRDGVRRLVKGG